MVDWRSGAARRLGGPSCTGQTPAGDVRIPGDGLPESAKPQVRRAVRGPDSVPRACDAIRVLRPVSGRFRHDPAPRASAVEARALAAPAARVARDAARRPRPRSRAVSVADRGHRASWVRTARPTPVVDDHPEPPSRTPTGSLWAAHGRPDELRPPLPQRARADRAPGHAEVAGAPAGARRASGRRGHPSTGHALLDRPSSTRSGAPAAMPVGQRARGGDERLAGRAGAAPSAAARSASSSLNTSSSSSTGRRADDLGARRRWPARRSASASVRCSPCDACVRAVEAVEREAPLVAVRTDERDAPVDSSRRRGARARRAARRSSVVRVVGVALRRPTRPRSASSTRRASPASARVGVARPRVRAGRPAAAGRATSSVAGADELLVEHVERRRGVGVADAAAQQRVALLQHPLVVGAGRRRSAARASTSRSSR